MNKKIKDILTKGLEIYSNSTHEYYICKNYLDKINDGRLLTKDDEVFLKNRLKELNWRNI